MPVIEHETHEKVIQKEGFRYGCHNRPRPREYYPVISQFSGEAWRYTQSTDCRFDMSLTDPACEGCEWRGSGEKYAEEIRRKGK